MASALIFSKHLGLQKHCEQPTIPKKCLEIRGPLFLYCGRVSCPSGCLQLLMLGPLGWGSLRRPPSCCCCWCSGLLQTQMSLPSCSCSLGSLHPSSSSCCSLGPCTCSCSCGLSASLCTLCSLCTPQHPLLRNLSCQGLQAARCTLLRSSSLCFFLGLRVCAFDLGHPLAFALGRGFSCTACSGAGAGGSSPCRWSERSLSSCFGTGAGGSSPCRTRVSWESGSSWLFSLFFVGTWDCAIFSSLATKKALQEFARTSLGAVIQMVLDETRWAWSILEFLIKNLK